MEFYNTAIPIHLETDTSSVSFGARLLQVGDGMNCGHDKVPDNATLPPTVFVSKSLWSAEKHHRNIQYETLGLVHRLEKYHHYCFAGKVCGIIDHKPFIAILIKDVASLSQCVLHMQQYGVHIIYKCGWNLYTADWLSKNNHTQKMEDQEINGININVNVISRTVNMPVCTSIGDIQMATHEDATCRSWNHI